MCGFAGYIDLTGLDADPTILKKMSDCIQYRGPDDQGFWTNGRVGFSHRRLSILDTSSAGHQPMESSDNNCLVYNGELYNHEILRSHLLERKDFKSTSDTEVLLRLLNQDGVESLGRLNGIFAFSYFNKKTGKITLARDHLGVKPLYYARDDKKIYFSSEIKSILAAGFKAEFNRVSSIDFSLTGWTADDQNFLKGIQRLPPGCYLNIDINSGESKLQRWYMPSPNWTVAKKIGDDRNNWLSATKSAIETAVARQLVSDVPVGAFCSGGVDSSLVSAIAKRKDKNIVLFNVSCPDHPEVDEGPWAEKVARFLDTDLKTHRLTKESFKSALVKTVWYTEYPLAFLNTVPLYNLSALARDAGVKVLLSGEGADECFGGYVSQFKELAIRRVIQSKGPALKTALEFALKFSKRYAATVGFSTSSVPSSIGLHQIFAGGLNKWAELSTQIENTYGDVSDDWSREMAGELLRQMQTYMLPILHRTDRASMGASVEARVPFLDIDLVELALAMPPKFKVGVKGLKPSGKEILKEIACDFLPRDIIYRPKMGFSVPGEYYLDAWPSSWIKDGFVRSFFGLNEAALRYWLGRERGQSYAWLLTLEIWGQLFIQNRNVETVNSEYMAG